MRGAHLPHIPNPDAFDIKIVEVLSHDTLAMLEAWDDPPELTEREIAEMNLVQDEDANC